jgi:hypothetical protein
MLFCLVLKVWELYIFFIVLINHPLICQFQQDFFPGPVCFFVPNASTSLVIGSETCTGMSRTEISKNLATDSK